MLDLTKCKTATAASKTAREHLTNEFKEFLIQKYGEQNVAQVDKHEIAFVFGTRHEPDGFDYDLVATVKPVIKNWKDKIGDKRKTEAYDMWEAAEAWEFSQKGE